MATERETWRVKQWPYSRARGFWRVEWNGEPAVVEVDERYPVGVPVCPVGPMVFIPGEKHSRSVRDKGIVWLEHLGENYDG